MALCLRALLGDGDRLLDRVASISRSVMFADSELRFPESDPSSARVVTRAGAGGLAVIQLDSAGGRVTPVCSIVGIESLRWVRFREWWTTQTPVRKDSLRCTREFLVHEVANTDAVHVDSVLDSEYYEIKSAFRGVTVGGASGQGPLAGVVEASIRQISWEMEQTLNRLFS